MIQDEQQYRITEAQADYFVRALDELSERTSGDPTMIELEASALRGQLEELQQQLQEYELRSGKKSV